jgi:thioredoxin reductase (NADPH)
MDTYDAVIIGAGPAGLTAATYLARFRRRVLDGGPSRAAWIPESHNTPGFPHGVDGPGLLDRLLEQARHFGARIQRDLATNIAFLDGGFHVEGQGVRLQASAVLLATGVVDRLPPIPGLDAAIRASLVRMCPICDAYEAIDKRIAVLGSGDLASREAAFLRTYSAQITVLRLDGGSGAQSPSAGEQYVDLADLRLDGKEIVLEPRGRPRQAFDHLYLALGCAAQSELATRCGAKVDETGALLVDAHQMTSVPGLYAAGDLVRGLNQIAVATGEAAIAATAIHNRLRDGMMPAEAEAAGSAPSGITSAGSS